MWEQFITQGMYCGSCGAEIVVDLVLDSSFGLYYKIDIFGFKFRFEYSLTSSFHVYIFATLFIFN